ncbi:hypothetical protein ACWFOB_23215 [Bacillus subtilis]
MRGFQGSIGRQELWCVGGAGAKEINALGPMPALIGNRGSDREAVYAMLEARRFMAAVLQRRLECQRLARQLDAELARSRGDDVPFRQALADATELLVEAHGEQFARM